jgi:sugar lactone lactonase YvrE
MQIEVVTKGTDALGECPVWLADTRRLLRVDITGQAIVSRDVGAGTESRRAVDGPVGFALPAGDSSLVAGIGRELCVLRDDSAPRPIAEVEQLRRDNRFNDAACDACGRLWAGTMSTERRPGTAALYRVTPEGEITAAVRGATISNGLDWDLDATRLYYIDSTTQRIDAIDFDLDRGRLGTRRTFAAIDERDGLPDGLAVDAEGGVWVALFGGRRTRRYRPDGTLDVEVPLPVTNPTSVAFGGPGLGDLYVTTAKHRLSADQLACEPLAGSLLLLRPGVRGRLPHRFGGHA